MGEDTPMLTTLQRLNNMLSDYRGMGFKVKSFKMHPDTAKELLSENLDEAELEPVTNASELGSGLFMYFKGTDILLDKRLTVGLITAMTDVN